MTHQATQADTRRTAQVGVQAAPPIVGRSSTLSAVQVVTAAMDGTVPGTWSVARLAHNTKTVLALQMVTALYNAGLLSSDALTTSSAFS